MKAILKLGVREIDLVTEYTGHMYDPVLSVYYARARMYDAADRRLMAMDKHKGFKSLPTSLNLYCYCTDNPLLFRDTTGYILELAGDNNARKTLIDTLQKLTSDYLRVEPVLITIPAIPPMTTERKETKYRVFYTPGVAGTLPVGTSLIRDIIDDKHVVTLHHGHVSGLTNFTDAGGRLIKNDKISNKKGDNAIIYINTQSNISVYTVDSNNKIEKTRIPAHIILGHELIHAYHIITGTMTPYE